jgi:cytochrome P450
VPGTGAGTDPVTTPSDPAARLTRLADGYLITQLLLVAAELGSFAELAATGPVQQAPVIGGASARLASGYAEARELLAHPSVVKTESGGPHMDAMSDELIAAMNTHLLGTNPPDHTRLRQLVAAAFTVRRVEALAPRVQEIADDLLDELEVAGAGGAQVDLVAGFGFPLPMTVITELLGIPPGDRSDFRRWSSITVNGAVHPPETYVAAARDMVGYVRELIAPSAPTPATTCSPPSSPCTRTATGSRRTS